MGAWLELGLKYLELGLKSDLRVSVKNLIYLGHGISSNSHVPLDFCFGSEMLKMFHSLLKPLLQFSPVLAYTSKNVCQYVCDIYLGHGLSSSS